MFRLTRIYISLIAPAALLAGLVSCSTPAVISTTAVPTSLPVVEADTAVPSTATVPPTAPTTTDADDGIAVTFDGTACDVSSPLTLPPGRTKFIFENAGDESLEIFVVYLLDGHTFQDMLALQSEPGEFVKRPDWAINASSVSKLDLASGERFMHFDLDQAGEYVIAVGSFNPPSLWLCAPVVVAGGIPE